MKRLQWLVIFLLVISITFFGLKQWLFGSLPDLDQLPEKLHQPSLRITDRFDRLLYEVIPEGGGRQRSIPLSQVPLALQQATIATEDSRFYQHPGVDWRGILRAFWINLRGGEVLVGGSTITQQVARNLLLEANERTQQSYIRKLREAYLAIQLTRRFSKDRILELYLNQTYYGGLAYGVEAAAQTFFGKPASELDLAESALIAGLPQAPAIYNPYTDPSAASDRQKVVLGLMVKAGYITPQQEKLAVSEPLLFAESPYPMEAPHFVLMVRALLDQILDQEDWLRPGGLTVRTTLDLDWQHLAEAAIQRQIDALQHSPDGLGHNVNSGALVALDPSNGEVLALVGSPDYWDVANAGAINMALAPRQPGSALKPILYAAALDPLQAHPWTAGTSILDVTTSFVTHDGQAYTPANYDLKEHGPVLVRQALASSLNIPAVKTLKEVGLKRVLDFASQLGIHSFGNPDDYDLSLALGGGDVRLIDLTTAYAAFANSGWKVTPQAILQIVRSDGQVIYTPPPPPRQRVIDERVAWLISDILSDNNARTLGFGPNSVLRLDRTAAVKTGTTSNFHDNWTVGFTPNLVTGVWVGNTNYEPMREVSGVTGAAPVWHQFMRAILTGKSDASFIRPPGLVQVEICNLSGLLPTPDCPYRHEEWFIEGTEPRASDPYFRKVWVDTLTNKLADDTTPATRRSQRVVVDLPPEAQPWARQQGLQLLSDLLSESGAQPISGGLSGSVSLHFTSPASQTVYLIAPDIPIESQKIRFEAVSEGNFNQVIFWLDSQEIARFDQSPYQTWWTLSIGTHRLWAEATSTTGEHLQSEAIVFEVKPKDNP